MPNIQYACLSSLLLWMLCAIPCSSSADPAVEPWWQEDLVEKALAVNEGNLVFIQPQPSNRVHHHQNRIILKPNSLVEGWIKLHQCHRHIDAVPDAQIVFHKGRVRDISIASHTNIGQAWVEGHSVQLRDVLPGAKLCVDIISKALTANPDGTYTLNNGPFMRRFLDGYYPMHVTMEIELPADCLRFKGITPHQQKGFEVHQGLNRLTIDTWFEGRLHTAITFSLDPTQNSQCQINPKS